MSRAPYDRQRDLVDGLMDQTAGLYQLRAQVERLLERNIASTELALRMEQHLRKNGNAERTDSLAGENQRRVS